MNTNTSTTSKATEEQKIALTLDGQPHTVPPGTTMAALVAALGHAPDKVSTALNGEFLRRDLRDTYILQPGDAVLLFQPITGG